MNDSSPDFDASLAERFHREHTHLPAEAFVSATLQRVATERTRATVVKYALQVTALIAVACASPWLIDASTLLSNQLDGLFATPIGMIAAALGVTIGAALLRRRMNQ